MNGFQLSFIDPILQVKSYHIQVHGSGVAEHAEAIRALPGVRAVVPFLDVQAIAEGDHSALVRAISFRAASLDQGFRESFSPEYALPDESHLARPGDVVVGSQLASRLGVRVGDRFSIFAFSPSSWIELAPRSIQLRVSGLFKTGFYELDLNWAFVSLATAAQVVRGEELPVSLGIKLNSRRRDAAVAERIRALVPDAAVVTWRETNRVFFNALRTEKALMMLLVGLIFVVVGFNIFHSLRRAVYERREEIGLMRSLGASLATIRNVFILEGFLIGVFGNLLGMALGLVVASNVDAVFRGAELLVNRFLLPLLETLLRPLLGPVVLGGVSLFSPRVFYIDSVPSRVLLPESLLICGFALLCATVAAVIASRRIAALKPVEVMRLG
jgi:lipoprotein-releasing system permease protein